MLNIAAIIIFDSHLQVELFTAETMKKEALPNLKITNFLRQEVIAVFVMTMCIIFSPQGRGVDYLVLWLDCDKEGENICFEVCHAILISKLFHNHHNIMQVIDEVQPVMKPSRSHDPPVSCFLIQNLIASFLSSRLFYAPDSPLLLKQQ